MRRSLLEVIFMSEKRKNLLFLLRNGPRRMEEILEVLNVSRHALLPQIKILSENGLVLKEKDICRLSEIGEIIVEDMVPLVGTLTVLEHNYDYWTEHELSSIPLHLLKRIRELGCCKVIEPDLNNMFELNKDMVEQALESKFVLGATAFLHPSYPSLLLDLVMNKVCVSIIMTEDSLEKHKVDYGSELKMFLESGNGKLYVYPENMEFASLFIAEKFIMMCLFDKKGRYDRKDLVFCNADAVHWGKELFEYYLLRSDPIKEI
ncbi:helix-turn-helix transcriptional regulator [Methanomethylovorans sp.]|uniref:helix-turn-helix transcriptional regulator n=1 Tax=Methanomethylovorans sp. TaxID=2758717 RepID=UPI00351BF309